jgi:hypothetical protein
MLATLLTGGKAVTYQDVDGDTVTVALSKAVLTSSNVNSVFTFDKGFNSAANEQLQEINLTPLGASAATGMNITITAVRNISGGDGFANVGFINATGINLGTVSVHGDLGRIDAGDGTSATLGLTSLSVHSMGVFELTTQANGGNLKSTIKGKLGTLNVTGDINGGYIDVEPGANAVQVPGTIGAVNIGGSLIGRDADNNEGGPNDAGVDQGVIFAAGSIGPISIKGSIQGRTGVASAHDSYSGVIYTANGNIGTVKIGGSLIGGNGELYSGTIFSAGNMGAVTIGGSLVGNGVDTAQYSGVLYSSGTMGNVTIGGSLIGGGASDSTGTTKYSGYISSVGNMGAVAVGGSVVGSNGYESGFISSGGTMGNVKIGGSVTGGGGDFSGYIYANGNMGTATIGRDLQGGEGQYSGNLVSRANLGAVKIGGSVMAGFRTGSGSIFAGNAGAITIGGSLIGDQDESGGDIISSGIIGQVKIGGDLVRSFISAVGQATPKAPNDLAIAGVTVGGRVEDTQILAGYSLNGTNFDPSSADAQIGPVSVTGDWIASDLLAGAYFNGFLFVKNNGTDNAGIVSSIASITIGGEVLGIPGDNGTNHFAFAAQQIKSFKVGGTTIALHSGAFNDHLLIGVTGDVELLEVGA